MAADFIKVDRTKQPGNQLVRLASMVVEARQLSAQLNGIGSHCFNGADYTVFESVFGLVAGTGANTLTLLGLIDTILNSTTDMTGVNRKDKLDEFQSRLSGQ